MLCYAVLLLHTMLCYAIVTLFYTVLCYDALCHATLCYSMLWCATLRYTVLCYVVMCCAILSYGAPSIITNVWDSLVPQIKAPRCPELISSPKRQLSTASYGISFHLHTWETIARVIARASLQYASGPSWFPTLRSAEPGGGSPF